MLSPDTYALLREWWPVRSNKYDLGTDGGATWSPPIRINDDPIGSGTWQWFGTLSVAPNGRIDVVWNDTRNGVNLRWSEVFYAYSLDGGLTWSANEPITPKFNSFYGWPRQNKLGDYYHLISDNVGANLAYAATFNLEQDIYFLRIGDYDCNGNGVGDAEDIANGTSSDCNGNGIPDECDIISGTSADRNGDGIPDECQGLKGDMNCDGAVNGQDIDGFALALLDPAGYAAQYPACNILHGDFTGDGAVNGLDIDAFVAVLLGPAPVRAGDLNCDGVVNGQDVDGFVLVLLGSPPYTDYYSWGGIVNPPCDYLHADMNGDGAVNGQDIDGFMAALLGR